jgi:hypothetical protein
VEIVGCRITGGGVAPDGAVDLGEFADITTARFGGQVGAPCGCIGCWDDFNSVQGEWTHNRKDRIGRFHASDYNSLVCQLDDGEGPEPRPAPANKACWSGIGDFNPTKGRKEVRVAFRVEVEDRGEPGAGKNAGAQDDVYRIRIWVPIPSSNETPEGLAMDACCENPEPVGKAARQPDIDDGGNLIHGNIQIHPQIASHTDVCPPPNDFCSEDPQ